MRHIIKYKKSRYIKKYGVFPEFRVGYHFGQVMVGEIGYIKRDIAFSGDVLNTTSRIQGLCSEFGLDILASKDFANVAYELPKKVTRHDVGTEKLRGKSVEMELVTYRRNGI
jgi:adenylate cyclase